jgi:organic radical activating enzyme
MCVTSSSPQRKEKMSLDEAKEYIDQTTPFSSIEWISLNGGEPLIHYKEILELLRLAKSKRKKIKISTNGFWAENPSEARRVVRELKACGLNFMSLSTDMYHQEFVPLENIRFCVDALEDMNLMSEVTIIYDKESLADAYRLASFFGVEDDKPTVGKIEFFDKNSLSNSGRKNVSVNISPLQPFGRGKNLSHLCLYQKKEQFKGSPCSLVGQYPYVMPGGGVYWCCNLFRPENGFVDEFQIGDLAHESLNEIVQRLYTNSLVNLLAKQGPYSLYEQFSRMAPERVHQDQFASVCDLCISLFARA